MNKKQSSGVINSLIWKFLERGGVQITQFVVSIVIARLVAPEAYGSVALLTVFISIATVFVQSGLSTALVQKKDADSVDYSSVFYYSLTIALLVYGILFFSAGTISNFYELPELKLVLRVMALTLFPGALNSLQIAILTKQMQFKKQFYSSMIAVLLSGFLGIFAAILNMGVWALVAQQLSYQVIVCLVLFYLVKWRPKLEFSYQKTKSLLQYGIKLLGARLIDTIYHNLESLIIGKKYSSEMLAFCNKGKQFPLTLIDNLDGSIQSVMISAYSREQEDISKIHNMLRQTMTMTTYIVFPAMIGLAVVGKPLIQLVLGDKWIGSIPFLQLYCFIAMLFPLQTANLQAINAIGRSDIYLKLMVIKRVIGVMVLGGSILFFNDVKAVIYACLITEVFAIIVNVVPNSRLLGYKFVQQMADILPNLIISIAMGAVVCCIGYLKLGDFLLLMLQLVVGVFIYIMLSWLFKNKSYIYILNKYKRGK